MWGGGHCRHGGQVWTEPLLRLAGRPSGGWHSPVRISVVSLATSGSVLLGRRWAQGGGLSLLPWWASPSGLARGSGRHFRTAVLNGLARVFTLAAPGFLVGWGTGPSRPAGAGVALQGGVHLLVQERLLQLGAGAGRHPQRVQQGPRRPGGAVPSSLPQPHQEACSTPPRAQQTWGGGFGTRRPGGPQGGQEGGGRWGPREEVESSLGNPSSSGEEMGAETGLSGKGSIQLKREEGIEGLPCCPWAGLQGDGLAGGESPSRLSRDSWEN